MKLLTLIIISLFTSLVHAVPESEFPGAYHQTILPFFETLNIGEFKNAQGMTIKYFTMIKSSNTKSLVILPGRTEPATKYAEVIYDLRNKGFNIFIMSHQGQGESDRLLVDHERSYIVRFSDFVRDFAQFMDSVVKPHGNDLYLLAHSMGGAISVHYLAQNPTVFKKAVLVAPMLQINTDPYPETIARYYAKLLVSIGKGKHYAPGQPAYVRLPFEVNPTTNSEARYDAETDMLNTNPYFQMGGATARWVHESLKATRYTDKLPVKTPVLLLQAGKDLIVRPWRQNRFCKASFCTLKPFFEAKHEILMEKDSIRDEAFKEIGSFLGF